MWDCELFQNLEVTTLGLCLVQRLLDRTLPKVSREWKQYPYSDILFLPSFLVAFSGVCLV